MNGAVRLAAAFTLAAGNAFAGHLNGLWEWLPGQEPPPPAEKAMLPGLPRSTVDRPDTVSGAQIKIYYVLTSDGVDEQLDTNGSIGTSVMAWNRWLARSTWGKALRIDLSDGLPDVSFLRLARTDAQLASTGAYVRDMIERDMKALGLIKPDHIYAVYYGGSSTYACGGGAWPPALPGQVAAMYLKGQVAGAPSCASNPVGASLDGPGYMEFAMLHEIMHTLGFVPTCAPHQTLSGHVSDSRNDLMYSGAEPWQLPPRFDIGRDDYYKRVSSSCLDFASSAFLVEADGASFTNLWWNPNESGWGINLNHQSDIIFATLFDYDTDGRDMWLVASDLERQRDNTFAGTLYRTTGPVFNASPWSGIGIRPVGTMTLAFEDTGHGSLAYSVNGTAVTKAIELQTFGPRPVCTNTGESRAGAANYQDLWWNPAESGWGINLTQQGGTMFATLFTYASDGRDMWLVASALGRQSDGSFSGALYRTTGAPFNAAWRPATLDNVGSMQLRFSSGTNGVLTYSVSGTTVTKAIERQVFAARPTLCQ